MSVSIDHDASRYLADAEGRPTDAVIPIDVWREISSELETRFLLDNPVMRERLMRSINSTESIPLDEALRRIGVTEAELMAEPDDAEEGAEARETADAVG